MATKQTLKGTPKEIKRYEKDGKPSVDQYGNYAFIVKMGDGHEGWYKTKKEEQTYFKVGVEAEYDYEETPKTDGTGVWKKITQVQKPFVPKTGNAYAAQPMTPEQFKMNARKETMRFCIDLFISDKIAYDKIKDTFVTLNQLMDDAVDELSKG